MNNNYYNSKEVSFSLDYSKLDGFLFDSFYLRDVKAYSSRPGLVFEKQKSTVSIRDKFTLRHEYVVNKESANQFVKITGDDNFIHRDCDIMPGAMTVSKIVSPLEILIPNIEIEDISIKFVNFSFYGRKTRNVFFWRSVAPDHIVVDISTYQSQGVVAKTTVTAEIKSDSHNLPVIKEKRVNKANLATVCNYFDSLGIKSRAYFQKDGYMDYTYPVGFLASLPSAEIVSTLGGQGGMINVLKMHFKDYGRVPINGKSQIKVKLERTKKRTSFNKIIANISKGVETYCNGLVIVNPVAKLV